MNAVTMARRAVDQIAQKNNLAAPFLNREIEILDALFGSRANSVSS